MLLQRLVADADHIITDASPEKYDWKPVKWLIELDADGRFLGCVPLVGGGRKADRGKLLLVPDRTRSGTAPPPVLLADTARYVLGLPLEDEKSRARHGWFADLHESAAHDLPDSGIGAVLAFLTQWHDGVVDLPSDLLPEDRMTFRIADAMPADRTDVRRWWAANWNGPPSANTEEGTTGQCLACGAVGPIDEYIPFKLKGLPNGQSAGTTLIGMNDVAFESHGFARGAGSRVCCSCGETVMKSLNSLLVDDARHMTMGNLVYVYWVSGLAEIDIFGLLGRPDAAQVGQLLASVHDGRVRAADTSEINIVALSASSARAAIRDWIRVSGEQLDRSLARWFALQDISDAWGGSGEPLGIWRLAAAAYRDARADMTTDVPRALIRSALEGTPLPWALFPRVVQRCRLDHDSKSKDRPVSRERAVLIRTLLASKNGWEEHYMSQLEQKEKEPAYVCGRLMALLEDIQYAALGKVGATVVDKYYGAASATPASVLGKLVGDAQNHLSKIRKDREGLYFVLQRRLEDVLSALDAFPKTLVLEKQGMFALGYYHERADLRASKTRAPKTHDADDADAQTPEE